MINRKLARIERDIRALRDRVRVLPPEEALALLQSGLVRVEDLSTPQLNFVIDQGEPGAPDVRSMTDKELRAIVEGDAPPTSAGQAD